MEGLIVLAVFALLIAGVLYLSIKFGENKSENDNEETSNLESVNEESIQENKNGEEESSDYVPTKPSSIVIIISGIMLTISIIASIVCFVACSYQHDDTLQIVLGIIGGYNLLQGMIFFALMYGVGHILKNSEEMNEKMDKLIEK